MQGKDDLGGWPDRATQMAVEWFPKGFLISAFRESLKNTRPRKRFIREMSAELANCPELIDAMGEGRPDWSDVFDALMEG